MYLDYTKIKFDSMGRPEVPGLLLQTMSGTSIGFLDNVVDLKLTIKFSEPSEISFQIPPTMMVCPLHIMMMWWGTK